MTATVAADLSVPLATRSGRFYVGIAAACIAVAVVGFAPSYWIPLARGTLDVSPIIHIHAFFFYGWTVLFLAQTWLAATGRIGRHREMGVAGVALATGMCFVGMATAIGSIRRMDAAGLGDAARAFSIVSVSGIALFAVLILLALLNVRKPETHKRLMLVATVSLLQAAIGRIFLLFLRPPNAVGPPPVFVTVMPGLVTNLLIVAAMVHDRRTRGRVHPVYWIAGAALLAVQVLRVPLSSSGAWMRTAEWMVTLSP